MANHESSQARTESQQNEPILGISVWVVDEDGSIVKKDRLSLFKRDAMLPLIRGALASIPFEANARSSFPTVATR